MAERSKLVARAVAGRVVIDVDVETALDLMVGFQVAHEGSPELQTARPDWYVDVLTLVTAAAEAAIQGGCGPEPALVPLLRPGRPDLRVVGGPA